MRNFYRLEISFGFCVGSGGGDGGECDAEQSDQHENAKNSLKDGILSYLKLGTGFFFKRQLQIIL